MAVPRIPGVELCGVWAAWEAESSRRSVARTNDSGDTRLNVQKLALSGVVTTALVIVALLVS